MFTVVADVETTGFKHWWHDVISCGLVILDDDLNVVTTFYDTCRPWLPANFNQESVVAHGFTLAECMNFQDPIEMAKKILHFLAPYRKINGYFDFVAHQNGQFDFMFLQSFFVKMGLQFSFYKVFNQYHMFSTIKMAKELSYEGNSLPEWARRLDLKFNHHNALDDALICAKIYKVLKEQKNELFKSDNKQIARVYPKRNDKVETSGGAIGESSQLTII